MKIYSPNLLKLLARLLSILCIVSTCTYPVSAQNMVKLKSFKWKNTDVVTWDTIQIPKNFESEDCVNLYYKKKGYYNTADIASGFTELKKSHHTFTKILTEEGVADFADRELLVDKSAKINYLAARIYRNGQLAEEYNPEEIRTSTYNFSFDNRESYNAFYYSIPNLAKGDVVELFYNENTANCPAIDYLKLTDRYSTCHYTLEAIYNTNLGFYIKGFNLDSELKRKEMGTRLMYTVDMHYIPSQTNMHHSIRTYQLPYVIFHASEYSVYNTKYKIAKLDWESLADDVIKSNNYKQTVRKDWSVFKQTMAKILDGHETDSKLDQLYLINKYINKNLIVRKLSEDESIYCPGYYLARGYINKENMGELYAQVADYLNIDLQYVAARDKYFGPSPFLSSAFYTDNFFAVQIDGQYHFIFFNDYYSNYYIDEFPYYLRGIDAVLFSNTKESEMKTIKISDLPHKLNKRIKSVLVKHPMTNPEVQTTDKLKNDFSTEYRHTITKYKDYKKSKTLLTFLNVEDNKNLWDVEIVSEDEKNNEFVYKYSHNLTKPITNSIEENLYYFNLKSLVSPKTLHAEDSKRRLAYFGPYVYADLSNINLIFDKDIILEQDSSEIFVFSNVVGDVKLIANQIGNMINCQLSVVHKENILSVEQYEDLLDFNMAIEQAINASLVIKTE